jgi:RNA polymerase sigma-70 factor (ECF subfamily)
MQSDFELLGAWQGGDKSAGDQLLKRHFDSVFRFFDRKVQGDAADLVQRTFMACVEATGSFRRQSSFRTFLFSIARRKLYDHWRTRSRGPELDFTVTALEDLGPTPSVAIVKKQEQRLLLEALRTIPIEAQLILELHYWEGMKGPELAETFDIPEGTVRSRLRRARESLDKQLAQLAGSPALLESTVSDLDAWAKSLAEKTPEVVS